MIAPVDSRRCSRCGEVKRILGGYYHNARYIDHYCIPCRRAYGRERDRRMADAYRNQSDELPKRRTPKQLAARRYYLANRERLIAYAGAYYQARKDHIRGYYRRRYRRQRAALLESR